MFDSVRKERVCIGVNSCWQLMEFKTVSSGTLCVKCKSWGLNRDTHCIVDNFIHHNHAVTSSSCSKRW